MYQTYLKKIAQIYQGGDYTEHSFRTPFQELLESFVRQEVGRNLRIIHEASRQSFGAPDFKIKNTFGNVIGYIECKNIDEDTEKCAESDQIKKYLGISNNFILTNYLDFLFFRNGAVVSECRISLKSRLDSKKSEFTDNDTFHQIFLSFFSAKSEPVRNSRKLSAELAKRTRILRDLIYEVLENQEKNPFGKLFPVLKKTVMPDMNLSVYADIYAETVGFGLFFLRLSKNQPLTKENILSGIPHYIPLLRDFFPNTRFDEWQDNVVWILDEIIDMLNNIDSEFIKESLSYKKLSLLNPRDANLKDPFIFFYEEFLNIYDRTRKTEKGVFYTPEAVVSYIIRSLDMILKSRLEIRGGFLDDSLKILDFATGTGTFIITLIEYIRERLWESGNMGLFNTTITDFILKNIYGFELLAVPYIICHLRIHEFLESSGFTYMGERKERAEIYLTNTLNDAKPEITDGFDEITEEGAEADRIKKKEEILVVMGNPPYSVSSSNNTDFIQKKMELYKQAVRKEKNIQPLSDDYIKFIRFAHWKIEQVKQGVIGIITNNSFVDGLIHRGMREELMRTFDEIYILNLHGNANKGDVCPDGSKDENLFDIRQGVCISFFVKTGKKINKNKGVYYHSLQGAREKKYLFLYENTVSSMEWDKLNAGKPDFWFVKKDLSLEKVYRNYFYIDDIFIKKSIGVVTGNDKEKVLMKRKGDASLFNFRPFDIRYINFSDKTLQRPRLPFMFLYEKENIGILLTKRSNKDVNVFITESSSSKHIAGDAAYNFPLYLYPDNENSGIPNFTESFQKYINRLYRFGPEPEQILGYIYAILFAPAYRTKYYEFLKIDFPRIPFTPDENLFKTLSDKGTELISLHLLRTDFEKFIVSRSKTLPADCQIRRFRFRYPADLPIRREQSGEIFDPLIVNFPVENPDLKVESVKYKDKKVWINKTTYFDNVPETIWKYEIGGYRVLDKWLKERKKHAYTLTGKDIHHFMNVCNTLSQTIRIQNEINELVKEWI